jgi:hypothetical protein
MSIKEGAATTYNMDILSLHRKHIKIKIEVEKCQSANFSDIKEFDLHRMKAHLIDLKEKLNQIVSQPEVDLPEYSPVAHELEDFGVPEAIENEMLADYLNYLTAMDYELINSQSARQTTSLIVHDLNRYRAMIAKLEDQLVYSEAVKPIDRPESSPRNPMQPSGNIGV